MERRRFLQLALTLSLGTGTAILTGCGGGRSTANLGGGSSGGPITSTGRVIFPTGFTLAPNTLRLLTLPQSTALQADNSFVFRSPGLDAALLVLADSSDRPVMLGFSGSAATGGVAEVSPAQTAVALLFYALGAFTLPAGAQEQVRVLLAQNEAIKTLANQISALLVQNPYVLADSDPTLIASVIALRDSLFPAGADRSVASPQSRLHRQQDQTAATLIQVDPGNEFNGLLAAPNADGLGLTVTNYRRRNVLAYIYQYEYKDANGDNHSITNHKIADPDIVFATSGLAGVAGSLIDYANGSVAYGPVIYGPYSLDLSPTDAKQASYRIDLIGNGNGNDPQSIVSDNPDYPAANVRINFLTFVKDLLLPTIASVAGLQSSLQLDIRVGVGQPGLELLKAFDDLAVILSGVVDSGVAISQSNARSLLVAVLKAIANNGTLRQKFIDWTVHFFVDQGLSTEAAGILQGLGSALNGVVVVVDKVLGLADIGAVLADWGRSDTYGRFEAKVIAPRIRLLPESSTLQEDETVTLKASGGVDDPTVTYQWTIASGTGTLRNPVSGLTGTSLDSASPEIEYRSASDTNPGDISIVKVEAFLGGVNQPNRTSLGTAQATITAAGENLIKNGDFSQGFSNWRTVSVAAGSFSGFPKFGVTPPYGNCIRPGNPAAYIDVPGGALGYIAQTITLPDRPLTLSFVTWVNRDSTQGTVRIAVDGSETVLGTFQPPSIESGGGCSGASADSQSYSLDAFRGKTIELRLTGTSGGYDGTIINFDDVAIR